MQFSDIIGQQPLKEQLVHLVENNRLSHALLFLGKEGTGALPLARAFAQYIVCEKRNGKYVTPAAEPSLFGDMPAAETTDESASAQLLDSCGMCNACKKAAGLIHPDIHYTYPVFVQKAGDKPKSTDFITSWRQFMLQQPYGSNYDWLQFIGAENKQGNIYAEETADIIHKMSLKSFEAEYKILIIWMPEALGKESNKLLKLIEEPPPNSLFILVAENEELLLPTILSRTQLVKVPLLPQAEIATALEKNLELGSAKAKEIALLSEGNYHEALQQAQSEQHAYDDWDQMVRSWLNCIIRTGPVAQVKWIEDISKIGREKQKQFFKYFTHLIQHAIRLNYGAQQADAASATDAFALKLNKICDVAQLEAITNELDQATYYVERNANPKMLFHALTIKLYHIINNKSVILMR